MGKVTYLDAQILPDPFLACAREIERHVAAAGWDQPMRLFALVPTARLLAAEPGLVGGGSSEPAAVLDDIETFSAIEQDGLAATSSIEALLGPLAWPAEVDGVALAVERIVVPPEAERDLPENPDEATRVLAEHPDRCDVRLLAAVLRDGRSLCLLRQRAHDTDDKVAIGKDIAPGLLTALAQTLEDDPELH